MAISIPASDVYVAPHPALRADLSPGPFAPAESALSAERARLAASPPNRKSSFRCKAPSVTYAVPDPLRDDDLGLPRLTFGMVIAIDRYRRLEGISIRLTASAQFIVGALNGRTAARAFGAAIGVVVRYVRCHQRLRGTVIRYYVS